MIIYGTEWVAFRIFQESYNFWNGTELCSGFYKDMIISGTEQRNSRSWFYQNMIIYGTERVAFRLLQESYTFRNGTERRNGTTASSSGFYKNMINYGTERVAFRIFQESYNFWNGTELCFGFYKDMIISGTEQRNSRSWFYHNMIIYGTERVAFRLLQESYNFRNGTELCSGFY